MIMLLITSRAVMRTTEVVIKIIIAMIIMTLKQTGLQIGKVSNFDLN